QRPPMGRMVTFTKKYRRNRLSSANAFAPGGDGRGEIEPTVARALRSGRPLICQRLRRRHFMAAFIKQTNIPSSRKKSKNGVMISWFMSVLMRGAWVAELFSDNHGSGRRRLPPSYPRRYGQRAYLKTRERHFDLAGKDGCCASTKHRHAPQTEKA